MVSPRKRGRQEMEAVEPPKEQSLINRIRNMWEFANLAQWIFTFGGAVKLEDNLDIEDLEMECLKTHSTVLPKIGLALLKFVSSHRGLTPEIFDEYTRRQYVAKAPLRNPYGTEEEPAKFTEFDVFTKIRVLQQLTQWTMGNPDRIRERMDEQKDTEQTIWRIEAFGWDEDDRTYFVLDDNRLYRQTEPPPPPLLAAKPKRNSKKSKAARRASKRRKLSEPAESEAEPVEDIEDAAQTKEEKQDDGFGGMTWECIAITLDEFNAFTTSIGKSKDPNEISLRKRIINDVLPLLEKQEESRKRKAAQKERELLNIEKLATAKRSSRIRGKVEQQKHEDEARNAELKRQAEIVMAKKEQAKWLKLEKERESRMMTREQRVKEREARRVLHEEDLANLSEDNKKLEAGAGRLSERHLKAEIEKKKQALEELAEEEDWIFDCICGAYGQIDDGTHSIACEKCNIWQHSKCVGVQQGEAERDDFHFTCSTCQRRAKDEERAKTHPPIKIKLNRPGSSSSSAQKPNGLTSSVARPLDNHGSTQLSQKLQASIPSQPGQHVPQLASWTTGAKPVKSPQQIARSPTLPAFPAAHVNGSHLSPQKGSAPPVSSSTPYSGYTGPYSNSGTPAAQSLPQPGSAHAFSSPHPHSSTNLPPPTQPRTYTFVNGNSTNSHNAPGASGTSNTSSQPSNIAPTQASPFSSDNPHGAPPLQQINNSRPSSSNGGQRCNSVHTPSPLASAPILTPSTKQNSVPLFPAPTSPNSTTSVTATEAQKSSPVASYAHLQQAQSISNSSALPPPVTGLSPTKHSPPRSFAPNGVLSSPAMIPPIASLLPSPHHQNLTPPVKSSDGEWNRPAGQPLSQ